MPLFSILLLNPFFFNIIQTLISSFTQSIDSVNHLLLIWTIPYKIALCHSLSPCSILFFFLVLASAKPTLFLFVIHFS